MLVNIAPVGAEIDKLFPSEAVAHTNVSCATIGASGTKVDWMSHPPVIVTPEKVIAIVCYPILYLVVCSLTILH